MKQYLLSIMQPDGDPGDAIDLDAIMRDVNAVNEDLRASGAWVFAAGLTQPSSATVVRSRDGDVLTTDGPYLEGKEHVGGFTIVRAADLDEALTWAGRLSGATTLPIEVRALEDGPHC